MDNKATIYYTFIGASAFSFPVIHKGRKIFVSFSPTINGISRYITTDKQLANKICQHRWFRMGLITMKKEETLTIKHKEPEKPAIIPEKPVYSIIGRKMASKIPDYATGNTPKSFDNAGNIHKDDLVSASTDEVATSNQAEEPNNNFKLEDVTSFMEAKEYFTTVLGVNRSLCGNKEAISALCKQYNIEFPNYKL